MRFQKYAAAAMAAIMAMSMVAYAEEVETEEISTEEVSNEEESTIGGETEYPVTVLNSDGTEVVIEKEPQKVVSLGPNITEMMFALDADEKLVARTKYCDYPSEAADLPSIGSLREVDMEALLALEPDLVIASTHISDEVLAQLEEAGITSMYLYEEHDIMGVYTMIETLGIAVNCQDAAAEVVEEMKETIEEVQEAIKDVEEKSSIYYVVGYGEYGDYTAGGDTFVNGILELAGAVNIAADVEGWSYSVETLLEKDPEFVLLPAYAYEDFCSMDPYTELSAVKAEKEAANSAVLVIDNNMLDRQGVRNAQAIETIAKMLYPDCFPEEEETSEAESEEEGTEE